MSLPVRTDSVYAARTADALLDHLPDVVVRYDVAGRVLYVNEAFVQVTGQRREAVIGCPAEDLEVAPETIEAFAAARREVLATGDVVTFDIHRTTPQGPRHVEYRMIPERQRDGAIVSLIAVGRDVTDREHARAQLEAERARLTDAQRIAKLGSWTWDMASGRSTATRELADILGTDPGDDALGMLFSMVAPEDRPLIAQRARELHEQRPTKSEGVWHIVRADGSSRHVHTRSVWTYDAEGRRIGGAGTFQDVTREVEAAAKLARQHAMLEESQRIAGVGSWELELATDAVTWSDELYRIAGLPIGTPMTLERVRAVLHPDDRPLAQDAIADLMSGGAPADYEVRFVLPDGAARRIQVRTRGLADASGRIVRVVGTCQDVTEQRALQERVRQSEKMEALGLLAGSIAHDFNNLLSAILGGAELARLDVPDGSEAAHDLDDVRMAAARAAQITQQLLAFSRKREPNPRVLDLRDVARGTEKLLRRLLPEGVVLDLAVGTAPATVRADAGQLEQVLMNLVVNARDAITGTDGDEPTRTGVVSVEVGRATLASGTYASLTVRDTGIGIDEATRRRIFEPFFTTKPVGKGTGIGLATVLSVASEGGGGVQVDSAPGAGAAFTVLLPFVDAEPDGAMLDSGPLPSGSETILLVEDESAVRETAARILERHGYRVLTARHGADALLVWHAHADEVDVLVTDLRMPEMGGQELVAALHAERAGLPVVVMSGYASGRRAGEKALLAREVFLAKPFTSESLLVQVRAALAARPTGRF